MAKATGSKTGVSQPARSGAAAPSSSSRSAAGEFLTNATSTMVVSTTGWRRPVQASEVHQRPVDLP